MLFMDVHRCFILIFFYYYNQHYLVCNNLCPPCFFFSVFERQAVIIIASVFWLYMSRMVILATLPKFLIMGYISFLIADDICCPPFSLISLLWFPWYIVIAGSSALDQICSRWVWREHNHRAVERVRLENFERWKGKYYLKVITP